MQLSPYSNARGYNTVKPIDVKSTPGFMQKEIERLKAEIEGKNAIIAELQNEIKALQSHSQQPERIHNERGAGRKPKITKEMAAAVLTLRQEGNSFSKIARIYTENTGISISKATVDKITKTWHLE